MTLWPENKSKQKNKQTNKQNLRPGSINDSHSFYRSLCVVQICGRGRVGWWRLAGPSFLKKRVLVFNPLWYLPSGWMFRTWGEDDAASPEGGARGNAQTCVTQARPWVLSNPSVIKGLWVIMCTHSYKVRTLFRSGRFRRMKMTPLLLLSGISCTDSNKGLWHWSECDSRLVWLPTFPILPGVFQKKVPTQFVLLCPDVVTSGLLFDVVAAGAVALLVGGALWEGKLVHLCRLLFHSQERLYTWGQRQIRHEPVVFMHFQ